LRWSFQTDAPLVCLAFSRESGEFFAADSAGGLCRLDRWGKVVSLTRGLRDVRSVAWGDTGAAGVILSGAATLLRFGPKMEIEWTLDLPVEALDVAIDPYGNYMAVCLKDGYTLVYDCTKRRVAEYGTLRPVRYLRFLVTEAALVGVAEYGYMCRHDLKGRETWTEKTFCNVGDVSVSGDGQSILLAGYTHGIQSFDGEGISRASYMVEGTANHVSSSFTADRVAVSTLERHLYWLDSDGELLWASQADDEICRVVCDPFGEWILCGFTNGRLLRLDWESAGSA
jgi:hypothetical protein